MVNQQIDLPDMSDVVVVVMGGGKGTRLYPLTKNRAKPAVSFGGKYRLIDITLANCLRSNAKRIFILTQFNSFSLNRHIWQAYSRELQRDSFIDVIAAEQTAESGDWFQGPADAVRQSLRHILYHRPRYILILSADQIYSMDYCQLLAWHESRKADMTIAARCTSEDEIQRFGILKVDQNLRVQDFFEKPQSPDLVPDYRIDNSLLCALPQGKDFLGSMGIYLFNTTVLLDALGNKGDDFGYDMIAPTARRFNMSCYLFDGYWEDVGTIEAFYRANMDWRAGKGISALFRQGASIITHSRQLPPSCINGTLIQNSLIADGCRIFAKSISRSIVGVRARIGKASVIKDSIIVGNDENGKPSGIGDNCIIQKAIIDKNVEIGDGCKIINAQKVQEIDTDLYSIHSGIVVVPRGVVIPPGTEI